MLNHNDYRDDVLELIKGISSEDSLLKFVEDLKEGLEDEDVILVQDTDHKAVKFHGILLHSKKDLTSFFEQQKTVPKKDYYKLINSLNNSTKKSEFKYIFESSTGEKGYIKIFDGRVLINNKIYEDKESILKDFDIGINFDYIKSICGNYEFENQGNTIICDGIACITEDYSYLEQDYRKRYPLEGYLNKGKIKWLHIDKNSFRIKTTTEGNILILRAFQNMRYTFYTRVYATDIGVIHSPYPVAILDNETLCFAYRVEAPKRG